MEVCRTLSLLLLAFLFSACGGGSSNPEAVAPDGYTYAIPAQTNDGWVTGHLDDHGFDSALIVEMMDGIVSGRFAGIDSVAIVRSNTLLLNAEFGRELGRFDAWADNADPGRHALHSTSKSVTSALVGIAVDQGYISSVAVRFYDLFSYGLYSNPDPRKAAMTLQDALTMRLGLEWDEWSVPYTQPGNDLEELMSNNLDYAKALLDLPMTSDPGGTFTYNTAATIAIAQALENAVGVPLADFADLNLFQPLQIQTAKWARTPTGLPNGGSGLFLESRDMIKFGQLFIGDGLWNGRRIVSPEWIAASIEEHVALDFNLSSGYGYQWWLGRFTYNDDEIETWSTRGFGGQDIFCIPSLNLVVAFTAQNYESNEFLPMSLLQDYILPSIN